MKKNNPLVLLGYIGAAIGFLFSTVLSAFPSMKTKDSKNKNNN